MTKRTYEIHWHQVHDSVMEVEAEDRTEARRIFRERTRRLGYGVTIQRIILAST